MELEEFVIYATDEDLECMLEALLDGCIAFSFEGDAEIEEELEELEEGEN